MNGEWNQDVKTTAENDWRNLLEICFIFYFPFTLLIILGDGYLPCGYMMTVMMPVPVSFRQSQSSLTDLPTEITGRRWSICEKPNNIQLNGARRRGRKSNYIHLILYSHFAFHFAFCFLIFAHGSRLQFKLGIISAFGIGKFRSSLEKQKHQLFPAS